MNIYNRIIATIPGYWEKAFEDIARAIGSARTCPSDSQLALVHLAKLQNCTKQISAIQREPGFPLEIDLDDLTSIQVALTGIAAFLESGMQGAEARKITEILHASACEKFKELLRWAGDRRECEVLRIDTTKIAYPTYSGASNPITHIILPRQRVATLGSFGAL